MWIFATAFAVRIALIGLHPIVFGGDTILRLANRDRILLAYQLPALQFSIWSISRLAEDPLWIRVWMAAIGAAAAAGFHRLARQFVEPRVAGAAALAFATNPFLIELSIVPYQEVLMLGALLWAFALFFEERPVAAAVALALACLTRYEAWIACPVLAAAYIARRGWRPQAALFALAPAVWIALHGGLSPSGTFVVETAVSPARFVRWVYLGWIAVKNTPPPVLALGAAGLWTLRRETADPRLRAVAAFAILFLVAVLFSAHGEAPDPERRVTAREATLLIGGVSLLAAFGLRLVPPRRVAAAAVACAAWGVADAHRFLT
ncbi:MAG: hypothetical protein ACRD96_03250, partial [Bryobacteraceae bacterium]